MRLFSGFLFPGYWLVNSSYPRYKGENVYYRTDFVLSVRNCLTFHYIIDGTDAGRLNVYSGGYLGKKTLLWRLAGDQGHNKSIDRTWSTARVPISEETAFQIVFEAVVGKEYGGYIAVDNVTLSTSNSCLFYPIHASNQMSGIMSNMIQHIPSYKDWLLSAVSQAGYSDKLWVSCYHSINDGWNSSAFHYKCLGKGPFIVILRHGSKIFGGFSDVSTNEFLASSTKNYASGRPTKQINSKNNRGPEQAVDGDIKTYTRTEDTQDPWWRVELEYPIFVFKLTIYNRHEKSFQDRLYDFEIIISNQLQGVSDSSSKCGGLHSLKNKGSGTFYCKPAIYGKYVTVHMKRSGILNLGEVKVYGFRRPILSTKSFLYTLSATKSKLNVRPDKGPAIIFMENGMRFGFYDLVISIAEKKCSNAPGDLYEALPGNQVFTGSNEFQPDDIEVLIVGDSLCDPPCLKGERCDEVLNKCVCDLERRDYKLCLERRDLQDKRDKFCRALKKSEFYARYDLIENISVGKRWRCYGKYALTDDRLRYNTTKLSMDYETRHDELMAIEAEFPKLIYDRMVEYLSIIYWPLDHPNDLKDLNNDQWSSNVYDGQPVRGVIDGALLLNGTGDVIKLPLSSTISDSCFFHPRGGCTNGLAISLWIKYYFSRRNGGKQVFFSTSVDGQDRGFVIYQINSSFPHVAVSVIHSNNRCTKVVEFARGIWTHLAVVYHNRNDVDIPEVYINSTKNATVIWEGCVKRSYKSVSNDYFTIGQSDVGAPYASIDDIVIVLNAETYLSSLSNVYNYYKGRENLHLNASFVLTSESWNDNLLNRESDIYRKISTSLLKNISDANLKRTVKNQEIRFWKKEGESIMGFTGCNILIGFHGRGYSQMHDVISYLEQATDIITDLSSSSNEVYLKGPQPVEVSIYGNSMKIKIQWNPGDKNLTHGILQKYVLFYVNGEDPSDQGQVDVVLDEIGDSTNYNLTVTKYFSRYLVSVRADTLEGEGKVSKGVNITTGILAPLGPPQTVHSWNLSSVGIAVSWTDINETYLRGPIAGYSIRINLADSPERAWESSKFQSILHNKSVIFEGLYKYTKYNVHVAGVAKENQFGPYIQGSVWTGEDAPEMAPSQLSAEAVDSTSIVVTWTEIQANKRNGIIIGYSVKWKEVNFDNEAGNISVPATPLSYTVTGLKIFTYYKVFVAGFTVIGIGPYKEAHVRTGEDIPDACPNITKAYNASSTSLFVMWQPIPKQNRNGILQGYVFEVCKEDGTFEKLFYHNSSSLEARITGLSKYQTYQIKIAGFTSKGRGNFSLPVIATTDEDVPESPPRNISKQKEESNAVTLNWQPPSSKQVNGIVLGYNIALKDLLRDKISYKRVNTSTHLRIDGLYPYTDYEITIRAFTRKGDGIVGEKIAIKTEQSAPTGSPTNVIVQPNLSSSSSITVSWGPVDRFKVNGQVTSYVLITFELANPDSTRRNVTISAQSNPHRKKRAVPSSTISTQLTGFQPFTQYGIQILAVTNVNGVPSPIYNVTTAEDTPSHPPLNLTAHNTSSTSIKVTWNEIPQKHKNGIIIGYKIHYKASHTGLFIKTVINDTERHTELTGLEKYELYTIQILGFTAKGDGNLSEPVTVRTAEDVPDDAPAKVSSVNPTLTTLTIQWETMPVRLENGIIRGYEVVLFEMNGVTKANAVLNDGNIKLSTVISGLDVWTNYTVQVKAFTSVGSGPWSPRVRVTTDEQAPQDTPFNVTAHFLSSTSIRVSWQPIDPRLTKGVARGYRVYYRALDTPFTKPLLNHTVGLMETSADLTNLYKYVEYSIYVVAVTNKDGNASAVVVTRTDEDKPDRPPLTLIYTLPDPTSIWLGWDEVREGYKNGIILGYKMTYRDTTKSDPPTFKSFLPDQFSTTLRDLDSYIHYEITLLAFTIKGDGPPFTRVIRTDQNTPYMSPGNFTAENYTTTSSLPVLWQPIPPHGLPGILLGYRLYYTPVSTGEYDIEEGETKEIRIPADKTRFVLPGLDIYTKYRVEISGFTVKGDGPLSITFGKTCRCQKRLSSSWLHFPPYVIASDNDSVPAGIIPSIAHKMVLHCCHHCKEYGKSYLDMKLNGYNMPAQEKHLETLKIHIDGMTDIIFPLAGYRTQEVYKVPYGFIGLVGTPGVAFVLSKTSTDGLMVGEMAASIWKNWTLVLLSLLFAFITGCLIWFLENRKNEEHFPKPFSKGSMEGFWFTFISMTTVGYGDRCPLSVAGRIVAITWTLFGVVLISMIVGNIAASLTTVAVNEGGSLYGMKAGALKNSFEYRFGIRRSAKMNEEREYDSYDEIYDDLVNQRIKGALLDSFAVGSRRDLFEKPFIRIKSIYDLNLASGIVTARNSTKLNRCLRRFTRSNAKEISDTIEDNARAVEVENEPLASELSSGVFDANNPVFTKVLAAICVLLGLFGSIGIIWEIIYVKRLSVFCNVGPDDLRLRFLKAARKELGKTTENFLIRLSVVVKHLQEKHSQERQQLIAAQSCKADEILKQS